jgi:hypothetical protein
MVAFQCLANLQAFSIFLILTTLVNISGVVCSMMYVFYPKSKLARSRFTKIVFWIFSIVQLLFFLGALFLMIMISIFGFKINDEDDEKEEMGFKFYLYGTLIAISFLIPVLHWLSLWKISKIRKAMALEMMAHMNSGQNSQAPQNVNLGNRYQPPVAQIQHIQPAQPNLIVQPVQHPQQPQQPQHPQQPQNDMNAYRPVPSAHQYQPLSQAYPQQQTPSSQIPTPTIAQPLSHNTRSKYLLNNKAIVTDHSYINQPENNEENESESLLQSQNRRSSLGFPTGIN